MTNLRCEVERGLSMVAQIAGFLGNKQQRRQYSGKLDPSHEDKFGTKTLDQPEPGSFFPLSLLGRGKKPWELG